ncbi:MAG: flagellar hook-basal body protein [Sporolactobacillus sp.]
MQQQMMNTAVTLGQIERQLDLVANNIANVGTTGYKQRNAQFSDLLAQQVTNMAPGSDAADTAARLTPSGIRTGSGARTGDSQLDLTEGTLETTGNPLDVALTNDQYYFTVSANGGIAYTRAGNFETLPDPANAGRLRLLTNDGQAVLGADGQPLELPSGYTAVEIDNTGTMTATLPGGAQVNCGRLGIAQIIRPQLLLSQGGNVLTLPNLTALGLGLGEVVQPVAAGDAGVAQGKLEDSNVDLSNEMTQLINLQRNYQLNAQSISMSDQMLGLVNSMLQ